VQSSSQNVTTNEPTPSLFYRPDALSDTQPTVSKHCRETDADIQTIKRLAYDNYIEAAYL